MGRKTSSVSGLGPDLKALRTSLGLGLVPFAKEIGTDSGNLSRWESGQRPIPLAIVFRIADVAPIERKQAWLDAAGLRAPAEKKKANQDLIRRVPLLKDARTAGTVKASRPDEIELMCDIPKPWLPSGGTLQAIRAPDDGMSPMIGRGFVVVVDVSRRSTKELVDRPVLARNQEGVFIRWLRRDMGLDLLMPLDLRTHPMMSLDPRQGSALVGEVVLWVGKPPAEQ